MMLLNNFVSLFLSAAPWLFLGFIIAASLKLGLPSRWLAKHLGNSKPSTTIKAAFIGAPLPLCSCGVIPAAMGLRRAGASKSATTSFLIATPETGVDSVAVSYALLGPVMAIVRPVAAITSAIVAGLLVGNSEDNKPVTSEVKSCCSKKNASQQQQATAEVKLSVKQKISAWLNSFAELVGDSYLWLLIGLVFAALIQTYLPESFMTRWGQGWITMLVMVLVGVPMYICATASTPIAAGLIIAGISPGAALVFMLAGPATNVATLMLVRQEMGMRALVAYLTGVVVSAMAFGWGLDWAIGQWHWQVNPVAWQEHQLVNSWWVVSSSLVIAILMLRAGLNDARQRWVSTAA
ncbi:MULTISPECIES: SO_0444 family Cu/Zn efflux transporter [unclassified Agarivorans]|uniref:SO_0444 family Cu/Zn efflux transporter n=1 Tax=unclassified Agarivorans TaxID=2636026 RepID=UPI003015058D